MLAVVFALRGTLTSTSDLERDAFLDLIAERARALGHAFDRAAAIASADALFVRGAEELVSPSAVGAAAKSLLGDTVAEAVIVARFRQIADRLAPPHVTPLPGAKQTIDRIASLGVPMAVLCNGWSRIARREAECAGFTESVLASEDIGVEKPSPRAFARLVELISVPAECIWYVGNDPKRDIAGAAAAGMTTVWLNASATDYPSELAPPTMTIAALADLLPPLCEQYTRSLLSLRHLMRTALHWREGHTVPPMERW